MGWRIAGKVWIASIGKMLLVNKCQIRHAVGQREEAAWIKQV